MQLWDDAGHTLVTHHRVRLAGSRLPVREHRAIVAPERLLNQRLCKVTVDHILPNLWGVRVVERERARPARRLQRRRAPGVVDCHDVRMAFLALPVTHGPAPHRHFHICCGRHGDAPPELWAARYASLHEAACNARARLTSKSARLLRVHLAGSTSPTAGDRDLPPTVRQPRVQLAQQASAMQKLPSPAQRGTDNAACTRIAVWSVSAQINSAELFSPSAPNKFCGRPNESTPQSTRGACFDTAGAALFPRAPARLCACALPTRHAALSCPPSCPRCSTPRLGRRRRTKRSRRNPWKVARCRATGVDWFR